MKKRGIRFVGLLTSTDSSILKVHLEHGFIIESMEGEELVGFITRFENIPVIQAKIRLTAEKSYLNPAEDKAYLISKLIDDVESNEGEEINAEDISRINEYDNKHVNGYLCECLSLMRLFKEGYLFMPDRYYLFDDDKSPIMSILTGTRWNQQNITVYRLEMAELEVLQAFLNAIKLPFAEPPLKLAHECFELSYFLNDKRLAFLACMMSMESLFNPGRQGELRYRISRSTSVLIGKDKEDSELIWKRMKHLYDIRCEVVHSGKGDSVDNDVVLELRDYVRRALIEFHRIGKKKEEILEMLNACGFDDRPWR